MKYAAVLASALAMVATAVASPTALAGYGNQCVTQHQAEKIVSEIINIFGHLPSQNAANVSAQALLAPDFKEYSDSVLALQSLPLTGDGLTANKAQWIGGIVGRPAITDITSLYIAPAGCHAIVWYFQFNKVAAAVYRVKGFNLIKLNNKGQIKELDLEFNSIAWGLDDGELPCNFTAKA
ncbi:hypothetical protein LTR53_011542 [Teratosphaeriaceae sp. CCFEE 6253]|nr:hypothetical protein LTR53_011542 [Teratosphaeriaceae sp. CCFEE 6253]